MAIELALETKAKIDQMIADDQGRMFRHYLKQCIMAIDDAFEDGEKDRFRAHMGVSTSGEECARMLWYRWRWAKPSYFEGRMIRLFNRGHLEEARFVAMMRMIGCEVYQAESDGKQYRVTHFGGHYGSAIDGVIVGIPERPGKALLGEFKTHNETSFAKLAGKKNKETGQRENGDGLIKSKLTHYVQMQQYMEYYKLDEGIYCAVNKDTDELYFEIVQFVPGVAEFYRQRSERIIFMVEPPKRLSDNPGFWKCTYCNEKKICHYDAPMDFNCRTCFNARAQTDGTWLCIHHSVILDKERQLIGCEDWAELPKN